MLSLGKLTMYEKILNKDRTLIMKTKLPFQDKDTRIRDIRQHGLQDLGSLKCYYDEIRMFSFATVLKY